MKTAQSPVAQLSFDEDESILYITMLSNAKITVANSKQHSLAIEEITAGKPYLALIDIGNTLQTQDDAIKYSAMPHHLPNRIAAAYYNPNFANRLVIESFRKLSKPAFSVQIFHTIDEAKQWLKQQKPKH